MHFDIPTVMAAGALAAAVASALVTLAWLGDREAKALPWWAAAYLILAIGIAGLLIGGPAPRWPIATISLFILVISPTFIWTGARVFVNRETRLPFMAIGPLLYLLFVAIEPGNRAAPAAIVIGYGSVSAYLLFAVGELYRQRAEPLNTRWQLIAFLFIHATTFLVGAVEIALGLLPGVTPINPLFVFGMVHFEEIIFVMGSAIAVVVLVRERSELRHKTAARIDTLTGIATRRAFLDASEKLLKDCLSRDLPLALVICDLDRFKAINDTHGHATGDLVLQMFAHIARGRLRLEEVIGRLGGEEFAIVMPGAGWEAAYAVAERIRMGFAEGRVSVGGEIVSTTVSAGVASASGSSTIGRLLAEADAALYRAKAQGRNRVEIADRARAGGEPAQIVRVA